MFYCLVVNALYLKIRCDALRDLHYLKNVENTHGGVLLLVKLQAKRLKRHY